MLNYAVVNHLVSIAVVHYTEILRAVFLYVPKRGRKHKIMRSILAKVLQIPLTLRIPKASVGKSLHLMDLW